MSVTRQIAVMVAGGAALLAASGCGGPSRETRALAEKDSQLAEYRQQKVEATEREQEQQKALALTSEQNKLLADQNKMMAEKNAQIAMATNAKVDSLSVQISDLEKKLGAQKGGDVQVVQGSKEPGSITIRVANTVLFDAGKADLKSGAHSEMEKVAKTLKSQYGDHYIRIEGHTDSTPIVHNKEKFADNMELSQSRAKAVFDHLVAKCGMPAKRMYTAGYANAQPVAFPEKSAADRAKNRRVDIVILPNVKVEKTSLAAGK